ncbi:hypothetical protein Tco_0540628 [Tanacetum coccineum]
MADEDPMISKWVDFGHSLKDLKHTCSAMMTFKGTSMLQKDIPEDQNGVADIAGRKIAISTFWFPKLKTLLQIHSGGQQVYQPFVPRSLKHYTAAMDNGNIKPSLPEAQNGVLDTAGEDNSDINYLVSETQNGVADTTGEDNGGINYSVFETQNSVADTVAEDIRNISPLVE